MKRKVISAILIAGMAASLLAGCGGTEQSANQQSGGNGNAGASAEAESDGGAAEVDFGGEEITIKMPNTGCTVDDNDRVVAAINAITEEKLGLTVDVEWIGLADYPQQMNLLFSSQEPCDLIMTTPLLTYAAMKNQNELMDISDYLDEYGQDIKATAPTYLSAYTDGDAVYGMPVYREKAGAFWLFMREDILKELNLVDQAQALDSWEDFYAILDQVKAAHPELDPVYFSASNNDSTFLDAALDTSPDSWTDGKALDNLGDSNNLVYVDADGKVASYYTSDVFKNNIDRTREIYEKGYVNTDATTAEEDGVVRCKNQQIFSWITGSESDAEPNAELNSGMDIVAVKVCPEVATSFLTCVWGFAVPYTSENPEAAVAFMNELYTNQELANLFVWGEEGTDWVTNDEGFAQYPEGQEGSGYHSMTWLTGNAPLLTPWTGGLTQEESKAAIDNEEASEYLGFFVDTNGLEQTVTACVNVVNEYRGALYTGAAGDKTDSMYEEMCQKLEAAGINDLVAAYQEQLDAWQASK